MIQFAQLHFAYPKLEVFRFMSAVFWHPPFGGGPAKVEKNMESVFWPDMWASYATRLETRLRSNSGLGRAAWGVGRAAQKFVAFIEWNDAPLGRPPKSRDTRNALQSSIALRCIAVPPSLSAASAMIRVCHVTIDGPISVDVAGRHGTRRKSGAGRRSGANDRLWPIATNDALTANRRFRGIADMDRFSSSNDL